MLHDWIQVYKVDSISLGISWKLVEVEHQCHNAALLIDSLVINLSPDHRDYVAYHEYSLLESDDTTLNSST